jgi:hypothetical protein
MDFPVTFLQEYGVYCIMGLIGLLLLLMYSLTALENRNNKHDPKKYLPKKVFIPLLVVFVLLPFSGYLFISVINPHFTGYGYTVHDEKESMHSDSILWAVNKWSISGKGSHSSYVYRLQAINLHTGKRVFKKLVKKELTLLDHNKRTVWVMMEKDGNITGLDLLTGNVEQVLNAENLPQQFPSLGSPVKSYEFDAEAKRLEVITQKGASLFLDLSTGKSSSEKKNGTEGTLYEFDEHYGISEREDSLSQNFHTIFSFDQNEGVQHLQNGSKQVLNADLRFFKGSFLCFDTSTSSAAEPGDQVFLWSYSSLKETACIIRCVSFSGKLIWEVKQEQLQAEDFFNPVPDLRSAFVYQNALIVQLEGFLISLDRVSGKLNWSTRL